MKVYEREGRGTLLYILVWSNLQNSLLCQQPMHKVLRYMIKFASEFGNTPIVIVLSEKSAKVLLFPLKDEESL